jgi:DnaJ-class molecular chaperone
LKTVKIPKFAEHGKVIHFDDEGHQTVFINKGEDGDLKVKIKVEDKPDVRREGLDIISKHHLTLTEALLGT